MSIAVAGGGVIGLACAFELSWRGHSVTVFDPGDLSRSTSWAAAGMIAPAYEVMLHGGGADTPLARLCFESAALWPDFARSLSRESGLPVGYRREPALALARTQAEASRLDALASDLEAAGRPARRIGLEAARQHAGVSSTLRAALELPDDHQVDNRHLLQAFRLNMGRGRFQQVRQAVTSPHELRADGFDAVIWARGTSERGVEGLVKGQAIALQTFAGAPRQVLRFGAGYIVPKPDRIVIGATSEEAYAHTGVSDEATRRLLRAASDVLPALEGADILEAWTGLRPRRASGAPLIGAIAPNEFVAAAHFRNGILLAPATAVRLADMIEGQTAARDAEAFFPADAGATA